MAKYEDGEDLGVEIEIEIEKGSDLSGGQNDGTVHRDAKGCMPHEDEKNKPDDKRQNDGTVHPDAKPDDKRQNDGIDLPDARGYMSSEDEDEEVIQQPNVASGRTEAHGIDLPDAIPGMSLEDEDEEDENSSSELIIEGVPHCDDCVVMFASMAGK